MTTDAGPIIRLRDVYKTYQLGQEVVYALDGVSLDVYEGEFVAITGASGSGKSTLMNILGCLDQPTSGTYELDGVDVASMSDDELSTMRSEVIGFVFQNYNLLPRMRAVDQVAMPLIYQRGVDRQARAIAALERVGLGDRIHHRPTEMSGGQQQRVAIARALVTDPTVLFADEPTGNLDTRATADILALLQSLNDELGVTILMVTHEADVAHAARRIILTIGGAQAGNYTLTQPTTTASITTKALTVSGILVPARQYDGGTVAPVNAASASLVGVVGADAVSLVTGGVIGNFANAALGVNKPVTITGLMLAGSAAGNYTLTQPAATASITPKILTVTGIVAMSKPFDGNTTAPLNLNGATLVGVVASEAVALQTVGAVGTFADAAVGGGKVVTVSGLTITGADAGNYTLVQPTLAGTILGEEPPADPAPPTEPAGPPVQELPGPVAGLEPDRAALPPDATAPVTVTTSVATSTSVGGTTVNASMSITVPPGAIPNATSIVVQSVASVAALVAQAPLPASEGVIIAAISASALDATGATLKGAFDEPVAITVSVPSASVPAGARAADFVIVFWTGNGWQELVTQVAQRNDGSVEVTAALTHFSVYAVKYRAAPPPPQSPPPTGAPGFGAFPPVFSAGLQAFVVFDGGSVDSLEVAARRAGASGVWVQDERGAFHLLVVDGPAFLRDEFARAFPSGLRGPVAVTLTRLPPAQSMVAPAGADRPVSLLTQLVEWLPLGWLRPRGAEH